MLKQISKKDLNIMSETDSELWCFCPAHSDNKRPNLYVTKEDGFGYCFACGYKCRVTDSEFSGKKTKKDYPKINWEVVNKELLIAIDSSNVDYLAKEWNINLSVLVNLQCGWNGAAFCFPMRNQYNEIIGIQRRYETEQLKGLKLSMEYSKLGLFVPQDVVWMDCDKIFITEGLSDLAVLLDLGFAGIGRPNALACIGMTKEWLEHHTRSSKYVVICDADEPGIQGGRKLTRLWNGFYEGMKWALPQQEGDLRSWVKSEGKGKVQKYLKNL